MASADATITTHLRVRYNNVAQLVLHITQQTRAAVDQTASDIQANASARAPRDTGSLAESIYVTNGTDSDYVERVGSAESLNHNVVILDEIDPEFAISLGGGPAATYASVVGVAAAHGIFQELGTRFQSPQPFLIGSVEVARDEFTNLMSQVAN
jgi:HK97 gp10 family phage protein